MVNFDQVNMGDILRIVGTGAPGFANNGDLVRVIAQATLGVIVENKYGHKAEFVFNCGAARLEKTVWREDFRLALEHQAPCGSISTLGEEP
jgi:hypothetical protein